MSVKWFAAVVTVAVLLAGCGSGSDAGDPDTGRRVRVVATTTILGDVVANVVGEDGSVEILLPLGADPHDYGASAQQVAAMMQADLVVANGLLLEQGLLEVLDSARADGANVLEVGPLLDPLPFGDTDRLGEAEPGYHDPHVWFDPLRMAEAARIIAGRLADLNVGLDWEGRAEDYRRELLDTDREIDTLLSEIPDSHRKLVSNHDALGYFAARYGFEIVGTVIPGGATLADPSSAELAQLTATIRQEGVPAIFVETTESSVLAEALAAEVGEQIAVVELYTGSLGEPGSGAETLIGLLLTDARRIAEGLSS